MKFLLPILAAAALGAAPSFADEPPAGVALVLGSGAYKNAPPLPACPLSARLIAGRLRASRFDVIERIDPSNGSASAAFTAFAKAAAAAAGAPVLIYICGYATNFDARFFILPSTALLERSGDVLTQGIAARSVLNLPTRSSPGFAVLDLLPLPGESLEGLNALLTAQSPQAGRVLGAVTERGVPDGSATPLATTLAAALRPGPTVTELAEELRQGLAPRGLDLLLVGTSQISLLPLSPAAAEPPAAPPAAPRRPEPPARPARR